MVGGVVNSRQAATISALQYDLIYANVPMEDDIDWPVTDGFHLLPFWNRTCMNSKCNLHNVLPFSSDKQDHFLRIQTNLI